MTRRVPSHRPSAPGPAASPGRDYDRTRRDLAARRFYHSGPWKRLRALQLALEPMCETCLDHSRAVPATVADHRIELRANWDLRLVRSNLRSLCGSCHSRRHAREQGKHASR